MYYMKYIWGIGMILSPFILLIAFFVNKKVLFDHFSNLGRGFLEAPIRGLFSAVLTFAALPIVSIYILLKAVFYKKLSEMQQENPFQMFGNQMFGTQMQDEREAKLQQEKKNPSVGEYIDYEELWRSYELWVMSF